MDWKPFLVVAAVSAVLASCTADTPGTRPGVQPRMVVEPAEAELDPGESIKFEVAVQGVDRGTITWSVLEPQGGQIDPDGNYTAPDLPGSFTVVARREEKPQLEATASVVVRESRVGVSVSPVWAAIPVRAQFQFIATVTGTVDRGVVWSVVEEGGGTIGVDGVYSAPDTPGDYTIQAVSVADPSAFGRARVRVLSVPDDVTVIVSPAEATVVAGGSIQFLAVVTGAGTTAVQWSVEEPDGGSVTENGLYVAPSVPGRYTVVATSVENPESCGRASVTVVEAQPDPRVVVTPSHASLPPGEQQWFAAAVFGMEDVGVAWSVEPREGGTISASGLYTADGSPGDYVVRATSLAAPEVSGVATVSVLRPPIEVTVVPAQADVIVGREVQFFAQVGWSDAGVHWSVREESGGVISSTGLYRAPDVPGTYHVVASSVEDPSRIAEATVNVIENPIVVSIEPARAEVIAGREFQFSARVEGSDAGVVWSVGEESGGTISSTGMYRAPETPGTYSVIATSVEDPSRFATAVVDVIENPIHVTVEPRYVELPTGYQMQFTARVTASEAGVTWSIREPSGGTISSTGLYRAPTELGTYTVVATSIEDPTRFGEANVNVVEPSPTDTTGLLPPDRSTVWNPGLNAVGGIPSDDDPVRPASVYLPPGDPYGGYSVDPALGDGTTNARPAIMQAIQAAAAIARPEHRKIVLLAPGTYRIEGDGLVIRASNVTLRGSGPDATRLVKPHGTGYGVIAVGIRFFKTTPPVRLVSDGIKGTNVAHLEQNPGLYVGEIVMVNQRTDPNWSWWNPATQPPGHPSRGWFNVYDRPIGQMMEVVAVDGNTVTFSTPFHIDMLIANEAQLQRLSGGTNGRPVPLHEHTRYTGIEDLYLYGGEGGDGGGSIQFYGTSYSWVKNVESEGTLGTGIALNGTFRCVVRDSFVHSTRNPNPGGDGYGIGLNFYAADNLIENNIVWNMNKVMVMRATGGGNVIAYNYMEDGWGAGYPTIPEVGLNASHFTTPHHELFEGNQSWNFSGDSYWGNSIYITAFRNHMTGKRRSVPPLNLRDDTLVRIVSVVEQHWWYSFLGNVLGTQDQDPWPLSGYVYEGTSPFRFDRVPVWLLGIRPDRTLDPVVAERTLRHGNFDFVTGTVVWDPEIERRDLPKSLYLVSKPPFFGEFEWPWVQPESPEAPLGVLPARQRFDQIIASRNQP